METWDETEARFRSHLIATGRSEETARCYIANLRVFGKWCQRHGASPYDCVRYDIEAHLAQEMKRIGRNTVALRLAALRAFYKSIGTTPSPTDGLSIKREKQAPRRPYSASDVQALLEAAHSERDRAMLIVAEHCGLRVSELVGLRARDVDLERAIMLVRGKGSKQRWVALTPATTRALTPFLGGTRGILWWTQNGTPVGVPRAKRILDGIARRAGVHGHWHRYRTTFATRFLAATHDLHSCQVLMGHANPGVTAHYAAFNAQDVALDQMRALM